MKPRGIQTGTGKSTVFPLAVAYWTYVFAELKPGLTNCAQPRRILARELRTRVRENRKMATMTRLLDTGLPEKPLKMTRLRRYIVLRQW